MTVRLIRGAFPLVAVAALGCGDAGPAAPVALPATTTAATTEPVFELTQAAVAAVLEYQFAHGVRDPWCVRLTVAVVTGGPTQQRLDIHPQAPGPDDRAFTSGGIPCAVREDQVGLLRGTRVDAVRSGDKWAFVIHNPNLDGPAGVPLPQLDTEPAAAP